MKYPIPDWSKGINADAMPSELAPGFCSSATNVRFRDGFAERVDGITNGNTGAIQAYWLALYTAANANRYTIYASDVKAYITGAASGEITRYTEGATISSITRVATTATLTTATAHGRTTGDTVSVWGALPSQYNGTYVITVTGATTFTYVMASDPGASASPVGLYSYNGATSDFTSSFASSTPQQYSGGTLNSVFLMNSPADGLYYWAGDTSIRLRKVPDSYKARVARTFKNYIFQLVPNIGGTEYLHRVCWSASAEPGSIPSSFTASTSNDAGDVELAETGGSLVDCLPLGDTNIIYKEDARYSVQYIGGNDVFRFTKLPGTDGLLYRGCVVDTPVGHVFLNKRNEVLLHTGGECRNLSSGRVQSLLPFASLYNHSFLVVNPPKNEVWVCIPYATQYCDRILIWNWKDDTWGMKTISSTEALMSGASGLSYGTISEYLLVLGLNKKFGIVIDSQYQDFGTSFTSTLERTGLHLNDTDTVKNLQRSRWNFDAAVGQTFDVYHGSAMTADATPTYASAATYTLGTTDYVNSRATGGKYLAVKVSWTRSSTGGVGRVRSTDLDVTAGGKR